MNLKKPEFLPFQTLPIPREQSIIAGEYIFSLFVHNGPISNDEVYEILTGRPLGVERSPDQLRIARQVFQVIGSVTPNLNKFSPLKILHALERA